MTYILTPEQKKKYYLKQIEWKKKNKDRVNFVKKEWRHKLGISKEYCKSEYLRNCQEGTKEKEKIAQKLWHEKNREKMNEYNKKYRSKFNTGHRTNYNRQWMKNNPLKRRFYNQKGNYRYKLVTKDLTYDTIQAVYEMNIKKYGTLTCYLCLKSIVFGQDNLEHKTPLCRGGSNKQNNLDVAHSVCNKIKGKKTEEEFKQFIVKEI